VKAVFGKDRGRKIQKKTHCANPQTIQKAVRVAVANPRKPKFMKKNQNGYVIVIERPFWSIIG
jgi:hypothetical protein